MALSEFVAMETAYRALVSLDSAARSRALLWLTDVLGTSRPLPDAVGEGSQAVEIAAVPAHSTRTGARGSTAKVESSTTSGRKAAARRPARGSGSAAGGSRRGRSAPTAPAVGGERAYRRMPDPEEVLAAYRKVGTVSGLAGYFGVPRHTIQGWARRLRREGYEIGRPA